MLFYDPYKPDGLDKLSRWGWSRCYRLEELLPQAEFPSACTASLTSETRHLLNRRTLAQAATQAPM